MAHDYPHYDEAYWNAYSRNPYVEVLFGDTFQFIHSDDWLISATISQSICSDRLSIGETNSAECKLKLYNPAVVPNPKTGETWAEGISWKGVKFALTIYLKDDAGNDIWVQGVKVKETLGVFYVTEAKSSDGWQTVELTGYDTMIKCETAYEPKIDFPAKLKDVWGDVVAQIPIDGDKPSGETVDINGEPFEFASDTMFNTVVDYYEGTLREYIGWFAALCGSNAKFGTRTNEILFCRPDSPGNIEGVPSGIPRDVQYSGETKFEEEPFTVFSVTIGTEDNYFTSGNGSGITVSNPWSSQAFADYIYNMIGGYTYYPLTCKYRGNAQITAGTNVYVENGQGTFLPTMCMSVVLDMSSGFYSSFEAFSSEEDVALDTTPTQKEISKVYEKLEQAIKDASEALKGAKGGIFRIVDNNGDGVNDGFIIADSQSVDGTTKCVVGNYEGIGISKNGGGTYQTAITHDGINADAITVGSMNAERVVISGRKITDYIEIDAQGITLASPDAGIKLKETSDRLSFMSNDDVVKAFFSPDSFEIVDLLKFRIGNGQIVVQPNGSLSLGKVRGE